MTKTVIAIVGPTAIGKTYLSIALAQYYRTEIISADSRQFYKEMSIGTAVPSKEELLRAPHHFIQHISIEDEYSVGHFENDALALLEVLFRKHNLVILVGGSGLYVDAILDGLNQFPDIPPAVRIKLQEDLKQSGRPALVSELKKIDPITAGRIDFNNTQRLLRALEVYRATGKTYASFIDQEKPARFFKSIKIGISAERKIVYDRINKRVDLMMEEGLEAEAKKLEYKKDLNALNTVGYKELFKYFEGSLNREEAVSEIKKNTRRFAKRQLTWYRKDREINWVTIDYQLCELIDRIDALIKVK